jgi:hypothetical protein
MTTTHGSARFAACAAVAAIVFVAQAARADDYFSPTDERVRISLGAMYLSSATTLRADSSTGVPGSQINGEDQFGLDRSDFEPKFEATVRVDTRHRLTFDYFILDRSGNATVTGGDIVFRNVVFATGDPLQTQMSLRTLGITYEYSFWHSETLEIAGTLGVHSTDISAQAKVATATQHILQTEDQAGPVPTLGIDATWVASRRFYFNGRAQYLDVHIHDISGSLGIYELDALYRYRPNVSFAVGYSDVQAHLASTESSQSGLFSLSTKGPEMFFRIAF